MEQGIKASARLGKNIRKARKAKGLTQGLLAARLQVIDCDLALNSLTKIELGMRHVSVKELEALRKVLDMDYADFFKE